MRDIFIAIIIPAIALIFAVTCLPLLHASNSIMVNVGGNGSSWSSYTPQSVEIKAGDTVTWHNPMTVSEPHTVSFLKDQSFYPPPAFPVPLGFNSTNLNANPDANTDPLIISDPNGTKAVIVDNARHYNPISVDSSGQNATYLPLNANYTLTGTEKFVSSGWLWPEGLAPQGVPPIKTFSVTFENAGTYDYLCIIHPWMTGTVTVK
jgi:plastocyanin